MNVMNFSKMASVLMLLISSVLFTSCFDCIEGTGPKQSEERELGSFSKLEVNLPADVFIHFGDIPGLKISAQANLLKEIRSSVHSNTLELESTSCINTNESIRIDLTVVSLSEIVLNGSGSVQTREVMNAEDLLISLNGSGSISADVFTNSMEASIAGSGNMILNGTAKETELSIKGSGNFLGLGLNTFEAEINISGSGDADIHALNKLVVDITGSGSVKYIGSPDIKTSISGSGNVTKKGN